MKIPVILTCVGSQVAPSAIQCIKNHPIHEVVLIGVDTKRREDSVGAPFVDQYYRVPMGDHPEYITAMLEIVQRTGARVILPGSDEEALSLSAAASRFAGMGCTVACSAHETVAFVVDKYRTMERLGECGVKVADICLFESLDELRRGADNLGFPGRPFVIKPRVSRGGRGFRVVRNQVDPYEGYMAGDNTTIDFDGLQRLFEKVEDKMKRFFLMEYLPGKKYSTDILVRDGRMKAVVIRNKIFPVGSPTQLADIVFDEDLISYAQSVMEVFPFDYFVQLEIGRDETGKPKLVEINPRLDATLPICLGIGINFYHEMIRHALGEPYSENVRIVRGQMPGPRFYRYWQHLFVKEV
ncbi:MAG: ATP-grasp domain-containing protein [Deltaproteobacteria bacterium]|nr:ATP-grasp domain-containing protein [Deltaproteobacteria bacterium]